MSKTKFLDYYNSEYIFIFDYYDIPLFYISKNQQNNSYYLFYFLDDNEYLFRRLNKKGIELLFSGIDIREILNSFYDENSLKILRFEEDDVEISSVEDYVTQNNMNLEDILPDEGEYIEYDIKNNMSNEDMKEQYQYFFPEFFNLKDLTLRLVDENNSNNLPVEIVLESIEYISKVFNHFKSRILEDGRMPSSNLKIAAFTEGSFKIEFKVEDDAQGSLFKDDINFDDMIAFINNLQFSESKLYSKEEIIVNKSLITATNDFCEILEDENLNVEFFNNDKIVANLTTNSKKNKVLSNIYDTLKEEEKVVIIHEETFTVSGEVLSANKSRNNFKIATQQYGDISGIFEKHLFKRIKNSEEQITVSKDISATIKKVIEAHPEFSLEKVKFIMESFDQ